MARLARQQSVEVEVDVDVDAQAEVSENELLPELSTLLNLKGCTRKSSSAKDTKRLNSATTTSSPTTRSSPRRRGTVATPSARHAVGNSFEFRNKGTGIAAISLSASTVALPPSVSPRKRSRSPVKVGSPAKTIHVKMNAEGQVRRNTVLPEADDESGAAMSMLQQGQRSLKLAHVNSLLLPLSQVAMGVDEESDVKLIWSSRGDGAKRAGVARLGLSAIDETKSLHKVGAGDMDEQNARRASPKRAAKERANCLSRLVLKEARCDDEEDSEIDSDEGEAFTDLSGFIVDDDADLSFHGSDSDGNVDFDSVAETSKRKEQSRTQRLQRWRNEARARMESKDEDVIAGKENITVGDIAHDLLNLKLCAPTDEQQRAKEVEVIDLTYSPPKAQPDLKPKSTTTKSKDERPSPTKRSPSDTNPFVSGENDRLLKFSPPRFKSPAKIPLKSSNSTTTTDNPASKIADSNQDAKPYTTPPTTPPASPTKLKSPSKLHLLSPSKRGTAIPTSPHRQSIDAFWSSDVINTWNDQYSPRKSPLTVSPKKRGLARLLDFGIWSDADSDNEDAAVSKNDTSSSSDPPTPTRCSVSPRKTPKSPSKLSSPSKKALAESKKLFLSTRNTSAQSLLAHLDTHITSGKLSALSASTGGVRILWSKNLRSTAGRANWRRTVTSPPPQEPASSVKSKASSDSASGKGGNVTEAKPLVQHYATIELAEKVIDSDSRLVNTLAHEFCHLANFMVSGVRDQPHGVSFKAWAEKVTTHLRTAPHLPLIYRAVEVTTKHSYVINHKYLWICAGQSPPLGSAQAAARAFLALDDDPGCGAEYGRHSRSIDPDKHRCGKCKGLLVQVRPKVKVKVGRVELDHKGASPRKGKRANSAKRRIGSDGGLGENKDGGDGGSNDKLDGLKNALEDANLSD
jgi:predicted SprT family Zn-dependent metalloprotease